MDRSLLGLQIDHFEALSNPLGAVCVTFTHRENRDLQGLGFAGKLLLENGVDVIAVKSATPDWFQPIGPATLTLLSSVMKRYRRRAAYGSSMGAYGAIRFSRALGLDSVFAISPVMDILPDWETRYVSDRKYIGSPMVPDDMLSAACRYVIAYDPKHEQDALQVGILRAVAPSPLEEIMLPFAGHPVGPALLSKGLLKKIVLSVIKFGTPPPFCKGELAKVHRAALPLYKLAKELAARRKFSSALIANSRAIAMDDTWGELFAQRATLLQSAGQIGEACKAMQLACDRMPNNPHLRAQLAKLNWQIGLKVEANTEAARVLELAPNNSHLASFLRPYMTAQNFKSEPGLTE